MSKSNPQPDRAQELKSWFQQKGYTQFGFTSLDKPLSLNVYKDWLNEGLHGEMTYLERHLPAKEDPTLLLKRAHSAIVVGYQYAPKHPKPAPTPLKGLKIARYAQGHDYHDWLLQDLKQIINSLKTLYPEDEFLPTTDAQPVLERDLAYRAGMGWFGKNTCLIDQKKGSYFLIGEILTSLQLSPIQPLHPDRCGTCQRCIEACPTQAIIAPQKIDARRCISYLTIEAKTTPPPELAEKIGDHFFGCDICQAVCPWNEKLFGPAQSTEANLEADLQYILQSSNHQLDRDLKGLPLSRPRGFGLKRNAIIVAANKNLTGLRDDIQKYASDPRLGQLTQWALERLSV